MNLEGIYCFLPLLSNLADLNRLILQQSSMTMIVPCWEQRPWYPILIDHLVDLPVLLPTKDIVSNPVNGKAINNAIFKLMACTISGKNSKRKAFQERLETLSQKGGGNQLRKPITILLGNMPYTAIFRDGMWWIKT